jgi:hypothetical protein
MKRQSSKEAKLGGKRRKVKRAKDDNNAIRSPPAAQMFFEMPEMLIMELFYYCTLSSLFKLSKTCGYARGLVKAFFACNLRLLVSAFITDAYVDIFFELLETSLGAMGGSTVSSVLSFPYRHDWLPSNLNILVPHGHIGVWRDFLEGIGLHEHAPLVQVDRKFARTTASHLVFGSFSPVRLYVVCSSLS